MRKIILLFLCAALIFCSACSDGKTEQVTTAEQVTTVATTAAGPTTDAYRTVEDFIGKTVQDKRLVGKILVETDYYYTKNADSSYDVLIFTDGVCTEYYTYYFYSTEEKYNAALENFVKTRFKQPIINSYQSLCFASGGNPAEMFGEKVAKTMTYGRISGNWLDSGSHELVR